MIRDLMSGGFVSDKLGKRMGETAPGKLSARLGEFAYNLQEKTETLGPGLSEHVFVRALSVNAQHYPEGAYKMLREVQDYLDACAFREATK